MNYTSVTSDNCLIDQYQRRIDYLRLSITDRCNLRCVYCMPPEGVPHLPHQEILCYEEIVRLAEVVLSMGISKIRITGGEPLIRKDVFYLCKEISRLPGLQSLSLTTNGVLLGQTAQALFEAGIKRINISLDTLNPEKYTAITGRDYFGQVWEGIQKVQEIGFYPIKINVVVLRGLNEDEIENLARLTYTYPFHVRFIELMGFGSWVKERQFVSGQEILQCLSRLDKLLPAQSRNSNGPARHYCFPGARGKIGLISPLSQHFCSTCNRLRVTADGKLHTCLFAQEGIDLKYLLRGGASDEEIITALRQAIQKKPSESPLGTKLSRKCLGRPMSAIGG